jgi:PKHD-type hydroxylase
MYLQIPNLITATELNLIHQILASAEFGDGSATASGAAKEVKHNKQIPRESPTTMQINQILESALQKSPLFKEATLPKAILPFLISRYESDDYYGWHTDSPFMFVAPAQIRCDISMTIFLSNPAEYEGGALEIETETGVQAYKLPAGDAILYPTTSLHQVAAITGGQRIVAVSWVESMIKNSEERKLLFQLKTVEQLLAQKQMGSHEYLLTQQIHSNLFRKWS